MSNALVLAVSELLGIEPRPSPADELYVRLSVDAGPVLDELRLVAYQLSDARAILAEARRYEIRPGDEYEICCLCGSTDRALVYNLPQAGFTDRPVCDDDARCGARAERARLVLNVAADARAVVRRAEVAKSALYRWRDELIEHRGVAQRVAAVGCSPADAQDQVAAPAESTRPAAAACLPP